MAGAGICISFTQFEQVQVQSNIMQCAMKTSSPVRCRQTQLFMDYVVYLVLCAL